VRVLLIDIDDNRANKLEPIVSWAGMEMLNHKESEEDVYAVMEELHPEIILIDTNSTKRDALEHLAQRSRQGAHTVITLGQKQSEGINRLAAEAGISLYAIDAVPHSLLQALIDITISYFHSIDRLRAEVATMQPLIEERQYLNKARQFIMKNYGLAEEQAEDLLVKNANRQRRSVAELAKTLLKTGAFT
jgi:two-component system, response regulator / RNA-binding antiterminator